METREIKFQDVHKHYKTGEIALHTWGIVDGGFIGPAHMNGYTLIAHRQFTGLKDKNGVEIYEGDILASVKNKHEVRWINACFHLVNLNKHYGGLRHYSLAANVAKCKTVIGNIYQNPHLLNL